MVQVRERSSIYAQKNPLVNTIRDDPYHNLLERKNVAMEQIYIDGCEGHAEQTRAESSLGCISRLINPFHIGNR